MPLVSSWHGPRPNDARDTASGRPVARTSTGRGRISMRLYDAGGRVSMRPYRAGAISAIGHEIGEIGAIGGTGWYSDASGRALIR